MAGFPFFLLSEQYSILCIYHVFFINLYVNGHLGFFSPFHYCEYCYNEQILVYCLVLFPLDIYPEVELLDGMAVLF